MAVEGSLETLEEMEVDLVELLSGVMPSACSSAEPTPCALAISTPATIAWSHSSRVVNTAPGAGQGTSQAGDSAGAGAGARGSAAGASATRSACKEWVGAGSDTTEWLQHWLGPGICRVAWRRQQDGGNCQQPDLRPPERSRPACAIHINASA